MARRALRLGGHAAPQRYPRETHRAPALAVGSLVAGVLAGAAVFGMLFLFAGI